MDDSMNDSGDAVQDFFPGDDDSAGGEELSAEQQTMVDNLTGDDSDNSSGDADDKAEADTGKPIGLGKSDRQKHVGILFDQRRF